MDKTQHTPGPWAENGIVIVGADGRIICVLGTISAFESGYDPCFNSQSNARLIAAAPDMLTALKGLLGCVRIDDTTEPFWIAADDAVAKAEGSTNA